MPEHVLYIVLHLRPEKASEHGGDRMNIRNCKSCGKIFNYVPGLPPICPACKEALENKFKEVKLYIRDHKGVSITEVAEACNVDPHQIKQWLRDDRLEVTDDSPLLLDCEGCGARIRSGRFCDKCRATMTNSFNSIVNSHKAAQNPSSGNVKKSESKMRFLDN